MNWAESGGQEHSVYGRKDSSFRLHMEVRGHLSVLPHTFPNLVPQWMLPSSPGCIAGHNICSVMYPFHKLQPSLNYTFLRKPFSPHPQLQKQLSFRPILIQIGQVDYLIILTAFFILGIVSIKVGWFLFQKLAYLKSPKTWGIVIPYIRRTKSKEANETVCTICITIWHQLSSA